MEWKDIITAPKDGRWFIAYDLKHKWRSARSYACIVKFDTKKGGFWDYHGMAYGNLTHWMELPQPVKPDPNPASLNI